MFAASAAPLVMTIAVAMADNQYRFFMYISPVRVRGPMPATAKNQTANAAVKRETTIPASADPVSEIGAWPSQPSGVARLETFLERGRAAVRSRRICVGCVMGFALILRKIRYLPACR